MIPDTVESYLYIVVNFLLSHNILLQGKSRHKLKFIDLFTILLFYKGPTPYWPIIMIMNNGKLNPFGRLKYIGVICYYNLLLYIIGQTAFYLFYC